MIEQVSAIQVYYLKGFEKFLMGRLAINDRKIFFEYTPQFLQMGLELSPFKLPLKPGVHVCEDRLFDGMFGVFNDSLPDGWGRLLLDRKLMQAGVNPNELTPLDRLRYVGNQGMGALSYQPEIAGGSSHRHDDLDEIADECFRFQEDDDQFVDELLLMNGSSAGARPKILVSLINETFQTIGNTSESHHNDWIIKFNSSLDPKDMGSIEYAYHLMAHEAGLDLPAARLFKSKKSTGYFGVKRFDRNVTGFLHMHTVSGLLHSDHRLPSLDYETLMKATLWLTKDIRECEKQFTNAVFNILAHNRDDHAKNFSFLMDEQGRWRVSPAYDLTFSSGPAGEHCTMVMGEGKNPQLSQCLKLAEMVGIKKSNALKIIDKVKNATMRWQDFAGIANVTQKSYALIQSALERVAKRFFE